jgi:hypothetical protein
MVCESPPIPFSIKRLHGPIDDREFGYGMKNKHNFLDTGIIELDPGLFTKW